MSKKFKAFTAIRIKVSYPTDRWDSKSSKATRLLFIKRRIDRVEILGIKIILHNAESIAKSLIVHDLPLAKEFYGVSDVRIVNKPQQVIIGGASLLLCYYHVLATKSWCVKVRKILILQGFTALFG